MELRQLKYFVKVAETLNFSEAARLLCVTQSTLSQQVKQLETELDTPLLIRSSHSVTLTEQGLELLPYAKRTLDDAETCWHESTTSSAWPQARSISVSHIRSAPSSPRRL